MSTEYRHEWKHEINASDAIAVRSRMRVIASPDPHAADGSYQIRSLYFDDLSDKALREKIDGVNRREKFRIRYYKGDTSLIHLEKKSKMNGLCNKVSVPLTVQEAGWIMDGQTAWMTRSRYPLVQELYAKMRSQGLQPKTIVDYTRDPFVFAPGNVRVTIDYNIRTGMRCTDFLDWNCVTVPAGDAPIILEVKWDEFLPDIIRDAVNLRGRHESAFSKYAACRIYG